MTEIERILAVLRAELMSDFGDAELKAAMALLGRLETKLAGSEAGE
ncbi:hypothetical protein M8997_011745 [Phyllobacterium sp. 21LDTY02-6]|nr:hypothetical protein [Phyllobacterium sp. 21LDTY02-6]MCO4317855.1 hypothetical protein [Phyllobacterium sp. 21LDTY02-6]